MYIQKVLSTKAKLPIMIKKGRKKVQLTRITKSGDVKNVYETNSETKVIKTIKHNQPILFR